MTSASRPTPDSRPSTAPRSATVRRTRVLPRTAPSLTRRRFLTLAGLAGLGTACGTAASRVAETPTGDASLTVLNWELYIDEGPDGTVARFEEQTGIPVDYRPEYVGNVEGLTEIFEPTLGQGEPTGFDVVTPTYWVVQRMLANDWLEPIPLELVPNHVNVEPAYLGMPWDRGARFHMPWQAGITGIAHDPTVTSRLLGRPLQSISDLYDPALSGRVSFIGEMREAVGLTMLANGDDPSAATVPAAEQALERIQDAIDRGHVAAITFNEFADGLKSGEFVASMAWSGDTVILQDERPEFDFVVPVEGAIRWFDSMAIPKGADNQAAAARWMNFVYDPANAAQITAFVQYISPVVGVADALIQQGMRDLAQNPILFPDQETARRLVTWGGMDLEDEDRLDARFAEMAGL